MATSIDHIFNRKTLESAIEKFKFPDNETLEQKKSVLLKWKNVIESQVLLQEKETSIQGSFLQDIFINVLGYQSVIDDPQEWTLRHEQTSKQDASEADGALGFFVPKNDDVRVVIELKDAKTDVDAKQPSRKDNRTPVEQAFGYAPKSGGKCHWVIVSKYTELRLYHSTNQIEYEPFKIADLTDENEFKRFFYLLCQDNLISKDKDSVIDRLYSKNTADQEKITKQFYEKYKQARIHLFNHIKEKNTGHDEIFYLEKAQKLLDRFIFICFCEDTRLLPERIFRKVVTQAKESFSSSENKIWNELKGLFRALDIGAPNKNINAFNGGLFAEDPDLDSFNIDDDIFDELAAITDYDFDSDLNVNILGHIFEQSISDLEEFRAGISDEAVDSKKGKRKKDGIFYTPEFITKYIVENTIGPWLEDRKKELGIMYLPELTEDDLKSVQLSNKRKKDFNKKIEKHLNFWNSYKEKLKNIKILDPACGSGAFLVQAFDFLQREGQTVNNTISDLFGGQTGTEDLDRNILSNNLYGVDLNSESVEITKLSLWIKTANKFSQLTILKDNIKCGNSLIDDPAIAGEKAFKWGKEFPEIIESGGFDIVIGNPPYGAYLTDYEKQYYQKSAVSFQGNFDIYFFFIEFCTELIKTNGKLAFITPDTWIRIPQAQKLREFVLDKYAINEIVCFNYSVFQDASVNTIIFVLSYQNKNELCKVSIIGKYEDNKKLNSEDIFKFCSTKNWKESDDNQFQIYQTDDMQNLLKKLETDVFEGSELLDVSQGIVPYSKENISEEEIKQRIYHSNEKIDDSCGIWVQGRAIGRYSIDLENFEFLQYGSWLHRPRKAKYFRDQRILIQEITGGHPSRISATIYDSVLYHDPGIISCLNFSDIETKYILAVINSRLISWYHSINSPKGKRTTFPKVLIGDIRNFPIKNVSSDIQIHISSQVDSLLESAASLQKEKTRFFKTLIEEKGKIKKTKKLSNFWEFPYEKFKKELKRQKIEFNLGNDNDQWREYFNSTVEKVEQIKVGISKTDNKVDQMVYQLYDLTQEEIQIVENSV
jgi:type I restriction-modification system DNA methylase subunit